MSYRIKCLVNAAKRNLFATNRNPTQTYEAVAKMDNYRTPRKHVIRWVTTATYREPKLIISNRTHLKHINGIPLPLFESTEFILVLYSKEVYIATKWSSLKPITPHIAFPVTF